MSFLKTIEILKNKKGLEFGGPTELFSNQQFNMPLYANVDLDGGNIIKDNHFQHSFSDNFIYYNKIGLQYNIDCAEDLSIIRKKYDFIVTSHVIEHIANPIKAIKNWSEKLLDDGGYILSIIPDYRFCFDRHRTLTTIEHLINDYQLNIGEDDGTHIDEQKKLHDWSLGGHKDFYELCEKNYKTRVVHHHTFTPDTVNEMFDYCGLKTIQIFKHDSLNIIHLAQKI
jgi:SAM-dependent methyltransferase